jgi:hypothetical protein
MCKHAGIPPRGVHPELGDAVERPFRFPVEGGY